MRGAGSGQAARNGVLEAEAVEQELRKVGAQQPREAHARGHNRRRRGELRRDRQRERDCDAAGDERARQIWQQQAHPARASVCCDFSSMHALLSQDIKAGTSRKGGNGKPRQACRTWRETNRGRGSAGREEGECGGREHGAEGLGRVALHQAPLPEDLEAEGEDDDAQEAHQPVARAPGPAAALVSGNKQRHCSAPLHTPGCISLLGLLCYLV